LGLNNINKVVILRKALRDSNSNSTKRYASSSALKEQLPNKVRRNKKVQALFLEEKLRGVHYNLVSCFNTFLENKFLRNEKVSLLDVNEYLLEHGAELDNIHVERLIISINPRQT